MRALAKILALGAALAPCAAQAGETQTYTYDELGRLTAVQYSGTVNNGQAHSLCYDPAGNRTKYKSDAAGVIANCNGGGGGGGGQPPVAVNDSTSASRCQTKTVNVTSNDSDPDGHLPLTVIAASIGAMDASPSLPASVTFTAPDAAGTFPITYTIQDTSGATANGTLSVTVSSSPLCP